MNKDIIIVGAFHEVVELCEDCGFNIIGIIDNNIKGEYLKIPILGTDNDISQLFKIYSHCCIVISPDSPLLRQKLFKLYSQVGFRFATIISPKANISRYATIGEGTIVQLGANVSAGTKIGTFVKINTNANIMHDNHVGNFSTIAPNAVLLGHVKTGSLVYIGSNSTILPYITLGDASTVGAGAVVTKDVSINKTVKGIPAK